MILVVGNFGNCNGPLGGQNVRTRSVFRLLKENNLSPQYIDLSVGYLKAVLRLIYLWFRADRIVILPGKNFIRLMARLYFIFNKRVVVVVVGGWLNNELKYPGMSDLLRNISSVWVQTKGLSEVLINHGIECTVLPNFKYYDDIVHRPKNDRSEVQLVYCSRISESKGMSVLLNALYELPDNYVLYIYGPFQEEYLKDVVLKSAKVHYMGEILPSEVPNIISAHDIFVFPTYFHGEGFPGAILDSFAAGLPIIATNWKYNSEYINENNGILVFPKNSKDIVDAALLLGSRADLRKNMSDYTRHEYKKYIPDTVGKDFIRTVSL
jgi:glycosyltransferase involved in cell wall biosynthesis